MSSKPVFALLCTLEALGWSGQDRASNEEFHLIPNVSRSQKKHWTLLSNHWRVCTVMTLEVFSCALGINNKVSNLFKTWPNNYPHQIFLDNKTGYSQLPGSLSHITIWASHNSSFHLTSWFVITQILNRNAMKIWLENRSEQKKSTKGSIIVPIFSLSLLVGTAMRKVEKQMGDYNMRSPLLFFLL